MRDIDETFRDLRVEKISAEITEFLNTLILNAEDEREFLDLVGVIAQSLGASLGTLESDQENGVEGFHEFLLSHIDAGFAARRKFYDLTGK